MSRQEIGLLTPKEYEVLEHLSKGFLYKEIAGEQQVNINTIKNTVRIFIKNCRCVTAPKQR